MTPDVVRTIKRLKAEYSLRETDIELHTTLRFRLGTAMVLAVEADDPDLALIANLERIELWIATLPITN